MLSPQHGVLRLGFLQDGDVGVGVFPEGEEVLVSGAGLGGVALERVGTGEAEMGERAQRKVDDNATVVEELFRLGREYRPDTLSLTGIAAVRPIRREQQPPETPELGRNCCHSVRWLP